MSPTEEDLALSVYQALRDRGGLPEEALAAAAGLDAERARRGHRRLADLGLVETKNGLVEPVAPETALSYAMADYHAQAAAQATAAATLQQRTRALMDVYRPAVARDAGEVEVDFLADQGRKNRMLRDLNASLRVSADSLHPGPLPSIEVLTESLRLDRAMIARGVRVRAIYPQSALGTARYARYFQDLHAAGADVRFIDHAPYDLLIFDGLVALLPSDPEHRSTSLIVVKGAALIRTYGAMYEDFWLRAVPYRRAVADRDGEELTAQERVMVRLMAAGLGDEQIARRMGVHRRTVQRAVAKLLERLHATSRFEAGLKLAQDPGLARVVRAPRGEGPAQADSP